MTDFAALLGTLGEHHVDFIVIGGAAAIAHGSARLTMDLDIVYDRSAANVDRLVAALAGHHPYLRGVPPGLPFRWDARTLKMGLNFTLTTSLGDIDLLGEVAGGGGYQALAEHVDEVTLFGFRCRCIDLPTLIHLKRAAGRPKDLEAIAELEAILEERRRTE